MKILCSHKASKEILGKTLLPMRSTNPKFFIHMLFMSYQYALRIRTHVRNSFFILYLLIVLQLMCACFQISSLLFICLSNNWFFISISCMLVASLCLLVLTWISFLHRAFLYVYFPLRRIIPNSPDSSFAVFFI